MLGNELGKLNVKIEADTKELQTGLKNAETKLGGFKNSVMKHSKAIGIGMTAMGAAILGGLGMATKSAASFEAGMREVNTMMGLGQEEFEAMSKKVLALAKDIGVNAVDSTKALYQAISAGVPKENVLTFMEIATKAAIGGVTDTETAVDGLTTVLNAFKMPMSDAQKVADIMFTTVKGGKTTFEELSASLFNVAPIAAATGIAFEEVAASLATMTKQGFPTAQATTSIRQAIVALQKPTKEMAEVVDSLGYASGEAIIKELGFGKALDILREATGGSNELLMKMFGSVEAGGAVLALTGENANMFIQDLEAMKRATEGAGAATEAFNEVERGSARQFEKAKESIKAVAIEIGGTLLPQLTPLIEKISEVVGKVSAWMEKNPQLTGTIVKVAAIIGLLLVVLGPLLIMLPGLITLLHGVGVAFTFMLGPIGLIILAIAGLIAVGVLVWKHWDAIVAYFQWLWGRIAEIFVGIGQAMWAPIKGAIDMVINYIDSIITAISNLLAWVRKLTQPSYGGAGGGTPGSRIVEALGRTTWGLKEGGIVTRPTLAMVGERGPEAVIPLGKGIGTNVYVTVQGSVISERNLADRLREIFIDIKERNTSTGF